MASRNSTMINKTKIDKKPKPIFRSVMGSVKIIFILLLTITINACGTIEINIKHPAIQKVTPDSLTAEVYFIRPQPVKPKGIADKPLLVKYDKEPLLTIEEGSYALIKIMPGQGEISTHSETRFTNQDKLIKVSRKRLYTFIAGRTYFIHLKRIDEEFRGIYYDPEPLGLEQAKALVNQTNVTSRGFASKHPIDEIKSVPDTPTASELEPAYPEKLYPQSPYLLKNPQVR